MIDINKAISEFIVTCFIREMKDVISLFFFWVDIDIPPSSISFVNSFIFSTLLTTMIR